MGNPWPLFEKRPNAADPNFWGQRDSRMPEPSDTARMVRQAFLNVGKQPDMIIVPGWIYQRLMKIRYMLKVWGSGNGRILPSRKLRRV